jgi:hypothetical protein
MFDILSPIGNENQNDTEIPSHSSQKGYHQENKQQMLVRLWGKKEPHTFLVGI